MAALPYVVKAFVGPSGGVLVDWLIKNKMSVRNTRRCVFTVGKRKCISFEAGVFHFLQKAKIKYSVVFIWHFVIMSARSNSRHCCLHFGYRIRSYWEKCVPSCWIFVFLVRSVCNVVLFPVKTAKRVAGIWMPLNVSLKTWVPTSTSR